MTCDLSARDSADERAQLIGERWRCKDEIKEEGSYLGRENEV